MTSGFFVEQFSRNFVSAWPCVSRHSGPCSVAPARQRREIKLRSGFAFRRKQPFLQFLFSLGPSPLNPLEKFSRSFASPVRKLIAQHDGTTARDFDCAAPFGVAQSARDCLNSQAKIVCDVLTKHWQNDETLTWRGPLDHGS